MRDIEKDDPTLIESANGNFAFKLCQPDWGKSSWTDIP